MKDGTPIEEGVYYDLPSEEFAKADGLSAGSIKRILKSPLHYIDRYRRPHLYPSTRNLIFGQAFHTMMLEPERFDDEWPRLPKVNKASNAGLDTLIDWYIEHGRIDTSTEQSIGAAAIGLPDIDTSKQAGKREMLAWLEERAGVTTITEDEYELLRYMRESWELPEHETVRNLFAGEGHNEVSIFWRDRESGVMLKARLDRLCILDNGTILIPDLKSTTDASYTGFAKAIVNFSYDIQAAHYIDAVRAHHPDADNVRFIFAAIEKDAPFGAAPYVFNDPQDIMTGQRKCRVGITLYAQCCDLDEWPSYINQIQPISMPMYAKSS